jgi:pyruvate ferredoxin oxidoreductase gamma subunit
MMRLKLYGLGGQGVVTASRLLVHAVCISEGRYAKNFPAYGAERRGAPIHADVWVDDEPVLPNSFVYEPDVVAVFDASVMHKGVNIAKGTHSASRLVANATPAELSELQHAGAWSQMFAVDATSIALDILGRDIPNSAMLGALAKAGVLGLEAVCNTLLKNFSGKAGEVNVRAAREAYQHTTLI